MFVMLFTIHVMHYYYSYELLFRKECLELRQLENHLRLCQLFVCWMEINTGLFLKNHQENTFDRPLCQTYEKEYRLNAPSG